jgi:hypothetical protein
MPSLSFGQALNMAAPSSLHAAPQLAASGLTGPGADAHQAPALTELLQASQSVAHAQVASAAPAFAPGIVMPGAHQLAALANSGVTGAQHNQVVGQVLADALHGGSSGPSLDSVLGSLPGHGGGANAALEALASHAGAAVSNGDSHVFAGFTAGHGMFMMEQMVVHQDAVQPHA